MPQPTFFNPSGNNQKIFVPGGDESESFDSYPHSSSTVAQVRNYRQFNSEGLSHLPKVTQWEGTKTCDSSPAVWQVHKYSLWKGEICLFISLACGRLCVLGEGVVCGRGKLFFLMNFYLLQFILISKVTDLTLIRLNSTVTVFIIRTMPPPPRAMKSRS